MQEFNQAYKDQCITDTLEENYMPYAMSVIVSRAIPEIDGFKPSHRKILYTMYKMNLLKNARTKSANVVGQTMKLNPHGDQAIYATMVRLSKGNDALRVPFVDSKGNFGKVTSRDMKFAAARYTEVKLDSICQWIFEDIEKNTVDFEDNYDGTMKEPVLLPTAFPNILANPNKGIAVGMASSFPSFNLKELCDATIAYIQNPETDLLEIMPAPDFSTGASIVYESSQMRSIYNTGMGSFKIRGSVEYDAKENILEIKSIPYTTTVEQIIDKIVELIKANKLKEINDVRDETDLKGLKITIDLKRGTAVDQLISKLYRYTTLEDSFSCNFNLLINGRPQVLGVYQILKEWLLFRRSCIRRSSEYDAQKYADRLHLLYGLKKVLLDIDRAIEIIKKSESDSAVIPALCEGFDIDDIQANYVADIKLRNLNKKYILNQVQDIQKIEKEKEKLEQLAKSDKKIDKVIMKQLEDISKKFATERKTQLLCPEKVQIEDVAEKVEDYNLKIFFTKHQYIKKISLASLRSSGEQKLKEDDTISLELEGSNTSEILCFSDKQNVYKIKAHEIEDHKASQLGLYLPNLLDLDEGETIIYCVVTKGFEGHMIFVFENGKVAKVPLDGYMTKTNRKKLKNAYADEDLVKMFYVAEDVDFIMVREDARGETRAITVNTSLIPEKVTKNTRGVQVFRMKKNSYIQCALVHLSDLEWDVETYRVDSIPKSGEKLDVFEKMSLKTSENIG